MQRNVSHEILTDEINFQKYHEYCKLRRRKKSNNYIMIRKILNFFLNLRNIRLDKTKKFLS